MQGHDAAFVPAGSSAFGVKVTSSATGYVFSSHACTRGQRALVRVASREERILVAFGARSGDGITTVSDPDAEWRR